MDKALLEARLAEADALLRINQQRRVLAEATLITIVVLSLLVAVAAVAAGKPSVILPLPPLALLLHALSFEHYAEVTVLGSARRMIEDLVNETLGAHALFYETRVAGVRKRASLSRGVLGLQLLARALTFAGVVAGLIVVVDRPWWAIATFAVATAATAGVCWAAYRDMVTVATQAGPELRR